MLHRGKIPCLAVRETHFLHPIINFRFAEPFLYGKDVFAAVDGENHVIPVTPDGYIGGENIVAEGDHIGRWLCIVVPVEPLVGGVASVPPAEPVGVVPFAPFQPVVATGTNEGVVTLIAGNAIGAFATV